ncbi:ORF6N domain-containing protein [Pseudoduganella sp. OTU4001]|uniref:ORF6N domain-containing protein n=1 Tax=Pseudoduganella sp. OTU4001 TaxID=3043854 RepID=UPI00313B7D97
MNAASSPIQVEHRIVVVREQNVLIDADLAKLYGVATKVLIQSVGRNLDRFPPDFMFRLDAVEWANLRSQTVTSNSVRGGRRYAPYAFTEQGVAMLSTVLNSNQAIAVNIEIMRAFVHLREAWIVSRRLNELEATVKNMAHDHEAFASTTEQQIQQIFEAIRQLVVPPETTKKRSIGFVEHEDKARPDSELK